MANEKILAKKQEVIDEIKSKVQDNATIVLFDYRGITDNEAKELRKALREAGADYKVYKNTLMARALSDLNIDIDASLVGPSALAYGTDQIAPIKILSEFAKKNDAIILKVGVVDGEISDKEKLAQLATIPSREGLLTMLAGGMIAIAKDLSICLDLYAKLLEIKELVDAMKEEFGVDPSSVAVAAPAAAAEEAAGPSVVTVTLVNAGAAKINVIKVIKEITGLGLKESKDIADNGGAVKENISVDEANEIKAKLEEAGAEVEVK